jgi:hypothetical protein
MTYRLPLNISHVCLYSFRAKIVYDSQHHAIFHESRIQLSPNDLHGTATSRRMTRLRHGAPMLLPASEPALETL